jgi:tripartite-type tricarboxylate transporter receptor subunit TctC
MPMLQSRAKLLLLLALGSQLAAEGWAQNYPSRLVRYVVADSAGGFADAVGRSVAAGLTDVFGQQVIVENRTGAGGNIGAAYAAKAPPDGHLMLQLSQAHTVNVTLYRNLSYDLLRDFAAVTRVGSSPTIVVVHPSLPVKSIAELVKLAKARPGAITYASAGSGTMTFVSAELFKTVAKIDVMHVPYRGGGEAITAVMSGESPVYFAPLSTGLPPVRAGQLRALAVTSRERLAMAPEFPTVSESGYPGFESGVWFGLMVPAKTPKETVAAIRQATVSALDRPDVRKRLLNIGFTPVVDQPDEFTVFIKSEIEKWGKIIRAAGLKAD